MRNEIQNEHGGVILVVEDDLDIREALVAALTEMNYEVHAAGNGQEALELLPRIPKPSLILLDLMMPVMNGWEFTTELGKDDMYSSIPIMLITAFADKINGIRFKEIMPKPIDLQQLLPRVEHHFMRGLLREPRQTPMGEGSATS